jgi:hypothetical protein
MTHSPEVLDGPDRRCADGGPDAGLVVYAVPKAPYRVGIEDDLVDAQIIAPSASVSFRWASSKVWNDAVGTSRGSTTVQSSGTATPR